MINCSINKNLNSNNKLKIINTINVSLKKIFTFIKNILFTICVKTITSIFFEIFPRIIEFSCSI